VTPGKFTKMVDAVEHVTFAGQRALRTGQEVLYVTERCVMRLTETGLVATEIMPGIEPERTSCRRAKAGCAWRKTP
jgi:propionate CoA-transferase